MEKVDFQKLKKLLPGLEENILLKNYTTFKIGGQAKYFYIAKTKKDLIKAIKMAKKFNLPFFILGGGSKLLVSDDGYDGIAIKVNNEQRTTNNNIIFAEAGTGLAELVKLSLKELLTGLEWAVGIPGTVGGAIYGNASAFGSSIQDVIKEVEVLDVKTFKVQKFNNKECLFSKKQSVFKQNKDLIILSAKIELNYAGKKDIKEKMEEYLVYRNQTQPLEFASAGCIFVNFTPHRPAPYISSNTDTSRKFREAIFKKQKQKTKSLRSGAGAGPLPKEFKKMKTIPAGLLIDKCGFKGKKIGDAQISKKHANFIVNLGNARADDVIKLIEFTKNKVKKKFGIELDEEIQRLG